MTSRRRQIASRANVYGRIQSHELSKREPGRAIFRPDTAVTCYSRSSSFSTNSPRHPIDRLRSSPNTDDFRAGTRLLQVVRWTEVHHAVQQRHVIAVSRTREGVGMVTDSHCRRLQQAGRSRANGLSRPTGDRGREAPFSSANCLPVAATYDVLHPVQACGPSGSE